MEDSIPPGYSSPLSAGGLRLQRREGDRRVC